MKFLFLTLFLVSACASNPVPQVVQPQPQLPQAPPIVKITKELDWKKANSVSDLRAILILLHPELFLTIAEDSVEGNKKLDSVKHLVKDEPKKEKKEKN